MIEELSYVFHRHGEEVGGKRLFLERLWRAIPSSNMRNEMIEVSEKSSDHVQ